MLHVDNATVKKLLLKGEFGLEKESLRVMPDGTFAHSPHPFTQDSHITRDFCENQTEINTSVYPTAEDAVNALYYGTAKIQQILGQLDPPELLWPFSNPPYIRDEEDIPIARFHGDQASKTAYRQYLSERYGRYIMTFSGIHINYSFSEELLRADYACSGCPDYRQYKNDFYVSLGEQAAAFGWLLVAVTAASPLLDSSFIETGRMGETVFNGIASCRCSELGYWNYFSPVFDYTDINTYADSIRKYVDEGWLAAPRELYYPVRLKPAGPNTLTALKEKGINHIELRMTDLNPLEASGIHVKDLRFVQLFLTWLASEPRPKMDTAQQVRAVQNFKNAARFDLKTVKIAMPGRRTASAEEAGLAILAEMRRFYQGFPEDIQEVLAFEERKFTDPHTRYAWKIREEFGDSYVQKGLELARKRRQEAADVNYQGNLGRNRVTKA